MLVFIVKICGATEYQRSTVGIGTAVPPAWPARYNVVTANGHNRHLSPFQRQRQTTYCRPFGRGTASICKPETDCSGVLALNPRGSMMARALLPPSSARSASVVRPPRMLVVAAAQRFGVGCPRNGSVQCAAMRARTMADRFRRRCCAAWMAHWLSRGRATDQLQRGAN